MGPRPKFQTSIYFVLYKTEFNVWCLRVCFRGCPIEWYHYKADRFVVSKMAAKIGGKTDLRIYLLHW